MQQRFAAQSRERKRQNVRHRVLWRYNCRIQTQQPQIIQEQAAQMQNICSISGLLSDSASMQAASVTCKNYVVQKVGSTQIILKKVFNI